MRAIRETASLTSKGQITLPKSIRQVLGVETGDKIAFEVTGTQIVVRRAEGEAHTDPAIAGFLALLERDMRNGKHLENLPDSLIRAMTDAAESTPAESVDEEIEGDVAL